MKTHHTDQAPKAVGPYSQGVSLDGWLFTSGQVGLDPATGKLVDGGFEPQARRVLGPLDPDAARELRSRLLQRLNR